jgi:hypothetical protein
MLQEWPGLLDVLAVLDGASQLRVGSGVLGAATCSLGNGGEKRRTRLTGCARCPVFGKVWAVEPSSGKRRWAR